ncbi:hypothetical protein SO694_00055267 [Aureococcus anophagefferens]|uniref:Uncharacterized protein n=1 Tax=Aureococcus anophagefferens TaxID=44056 RepID=A0ABR1FXI6_AURAN
MAAAAGSSAHLYAPLPDASGWRGDARSVADVMDYFGRCLTDDGAGGRALLESKLRRKALLLDGAAAAPRPARKRKRRHERRDADGAAARDAPRRAADVGDGAARESRARTPRGSRRFARGAAAGRRPRGRGPRVDGRRAPGGARAGGVARRRAGAVVDETAECFFLRTPADGLVRVAKRGAVFALHLDGGAPRRRRGRRRGAPPRRPPRRAFLA